MVHGPGLVIYHKGDYISRGLEMSKVTGIYLVHTVTVTLFSKVLTNLMCPDFYFYDMHIQRIMHAPMTIHAVT